MSTVATQPGYALPQAHWRLYLALTKPRVVALIVFTAIVGTLLVDARAAAAGCAGVGQSRHRARLGLRRHHQPRARPPHRCADGAHPRPAAADRQLTRAQGADLRRGARHPCDGDARVLVNLLTAALTFVSLIGYAVIYTVWLKRATSQNIVIGGAAGAAPPVLGWVAVTSHVDPNALLLFLIIFVWTPPHFWALAIARARRICARRHPDAAGDAWRGAHAAAGAAVHGAAVLVTLLPFHDAHERPASIWRAALVLNACSCISPWPEDSGAAGTADARVPVFGEVSDVDVRGAARGPLPAHDPASALMNLEMVRMLSNASGRPTTIAISTIWWRAPESGEALAIDPLEWGLCLEAARAAAGPSARS